MSADITINRVGPLSQADGTNAANRTCKTGEQSVSQTHGKYYEAAHRDNTFAATTAQTGVAPGTALGTTGAFTLSNPVGSGKRLAVQKLMMGYISGTLGAGVVNICAQSSPVATAPSGTAIVPINLDIGNTTAPVALPFTTSTIPTTAGKVIGFLCSLFAELASTANGLQEIEKDVDGEIVIEPGCSITLHATAAAGSTPLVVFGATWEEIAII